MTNEKELVHEYEVIVHPAGMLDRKGAGFWTEVVQLPACFSEGKTIEEAVENTRQAIEHWLSRTVQTNDTQESKPISLQIYPAV